MGVRAVEVRGVEIREEVVGFWGSGFGGSW